jgi:peptidoglycan hydrolase FlgJ
VISINSTIEISGGNPGLTSQNPRLQSAAHEFEASLMQEFLKPLTRDSLFSEKSSEEDESESSGSADALMSFGSQAMAKAISERGGFGIATQILNHFGTPDSK